MAYELPLGLPRTVVLKSKYNNKYMRYTPENIEQHGLLQFAGEEAVSPHAKFHVEAAAALKDLVHIRCAYNNKYWRRWSEAQHWIGAMADSPEEDQSKWSCTLFKPEVVEDARGALLVRFLHVQLNHYACLYTINSHYNNFLFAGWKEPNSLLKDVCEVVDRDSIVVLPRHVVFKGDNGKYLRCGEPVIYGDNHRNSLLEFNADDIGDPDVGHEVFTNPDGAIRIKSYKNGRFWGRGSTYPPWSLRQRDLIYVEESHDKNTYDLNTLFRPVSVKGNVIALRCLGNGLYCRRRPDLEEGVYLESGVRTISNEARLQVEEQVVSREIYDVEFRNLDGRIYDQHIIHASKGIATNDSPNPVTQTVTLTYRETKESTWEGNVSVSVGIETSIKTGVPFIAQGEITISAEFSGSYTWGETKSETTELTNQYAVNVSPYSIMHVSLIASKGTCDVPFSYTAKDLLFDGTYHTSEKDDGLYTGVNSYDYHYETREEKIPNRPPPRSASSD